MTTLELDVNTEANTAKPQGLLRRTKGAVLVEFLAVFFPIFGFFLGLVQLLFIHTANMITKHSAYVAARAAVVVIPEDTAHLGGGVNNATGARKQEIERAARIPLSTLGIDRGNVNIQLDRSTYGRDDEVVVTVTVDFPCRVPLGSWMACGGATKELVAQASMPNQGVDWTY